MRRVARTACGLIVFVAGGCVSTVAPVARAQPAAHPRTDPARIRAGICQHLRECAEIFARARGKPFAIVRGKTAQQVEGASEGGIPLGTIEWLRESAITLVVTADTDSYFLGHPKASLKLYLPSGGTLHLTDAAAAELDSETLKRLEASAKANQIKDAAAPPRLTELGEIATFNQQDDLAADVYLFKWDLHDPAAGVSRFESGTLWDWGPLPTSSALDDRLRPRWNRLHKGMLAGDAQDAFDWIVLGAALKSGEGEDAEVLTSLIEQAKGAGVSRETLQNAAKTAKLAAARRGFEQAFFPRRDSKDAGPVRSPARDHSPETTK